MFARVLDCQARAGRSEQNSTRWENDLLPILQKQPGFVDFLSLSDTTDDERLVRFSFWISREAAEEYHRQHYQTIANLLELVLRSPPILQGFAVTASTAHRIVVSRAA
jgi:heme-degrading monooxygenase HmoA